MTLSFGLFQQFNNNSCTNHKYKNKKDLNPINLGPGVNTQYPEYLPTITVDQKTLLFTRRIPDASVRAGAQEDFYESKLSEESNIWMTAVALPSNINTSVNEGAPSYAPDGRTIIFVGCTDESGQYGGDRLGYGSCDLFVTKKTGKKWSNPVNLPGNVNSKHWETQPSLSADGKTLYFIRGIVVYNRMGQGSRQGDIYVSYLSENGKWSTATKLPMNVNTKMDESSVQIHPDGKTLFFASNGHIGLGSHDLYKTVRREDGSWTTPENLGYPINTFHRESSLLVSADGEVAFFGSDRPGGFGGSDIYYVDINNGAFGKPKNLGSTINTNKNEKFPFINSEGALFFSSDGHPGLGLLDIFGTVSDENKNIISVINLGTPVNSSKDDFSFFMNEDGLSGFFASNRKGGTGSDDIYSYDRIPQLNLEGTVYDDTNSKPVANAIVTIIDSNKNKIETKTNVDGQYSININRDSAYQVTVIKDGYTENTNSFTSTNIDRNIKSISNDFSMIPSEKEEIAAEPVEMIILSPIYFNFNRASVRNEDVQVLDNIANSMLTYPNMIIKIEATKFTEVGYVGKDVESIIRDLVESSMKRTREAAMKLVTKKAESAAEERILDYLLPKRESPIPGEQVDDSKTRSKFLTKLRDGLLDDKEIEVKVSAHMGGVDIMGPPGMEEMTDQLQSMFENMGKKKKQTKKMTVAAALPILLEEEAQQLINEDEIRQKAVEQAENNGIVFLDEIDKVAKSGTMGGGSGQVSREGVQRDLLPLIEGSVVNTKYGQIKTDHILFIASGAFHLSKPSDLIPELQGRLPIRVELRALTAEDFERILIEPEYALIDQYKALMGTEEVDLQFTPDGIKRLAQIAWSVNEKTENIGARRLHTILETVLDEVAFEAPDKSGQSYVIDATHVDKILGEVVEDEDLSRYIL